MKLRVSQPATTVELEPQLVFYQSDGRNPLDGYKPPTRDGQGKQVPEEMGTPQLWLNVTIGDGVRGFPAKDIACTDGADFYAKAVAKAASELGLAVTP